MSVKPMLRECLRYYFITDDASPFLTPLEQAGIAIQSGASIVQYRNKHFSENHFGEAMAIRNLCKSNGIPFIVNDHILLARALNADGVHLGQQDQASSWARDILGPMAIIGLSASTPEELRIVDPAICDYVGAGPVFPTGTKTDANSVIGPSGLADVVRQTPLPVVAIGGILPENARICFDAGAAGVSMISWISRSADPRGNALAMSAACGRRPLLFLNEGWTDEFRLIDAMIGKTRRRTADSSFIDIHPGDDAALLKPLNRPVITTDTQKEGIHFHLSWQTLEEIGFKAVSVTFSDLAACYASPVSLFVNIEAPEWFSEPMAESLYRGIDHGLTMYGGVLGGGNVSAGPLLSLDLFAVGEGWNVAFPERGNAMPGDGLYCTGPLGLARAGLFVLMARDDSFPELIHHFKDPRARFDAARVLAEEGVPCVMDISDGLAGDAAHIAQASDLTIRLTLSVEDAVPELLRYCDAEKQDPVDWMTSGGEDYELLFACAPKIFERIQKRLPGSFRVGECIPFAGRCVENISDRVRSFQHGGRNTDS